MPIDCSLVERLMLIIIVIISENYIKSVLIQMRRKDLPARKLEHCKNYMVVVTQTWLHQLLDYTVINYVASCNVNWTCRQDFCKLQSQ